MPFDSVASHLGGEIAELEEYEGALDRFLALYRQSESKTGYTEKQAAILSKLLRKLSRDKEFKQRQLDDHRRRNQERGIKY